MLSKAMLASIRRTSQKVMCDVAVILTPVELSGEGQMVQDVYGSLVIPTIDANTPRLPCRLEYIDRIPSIVDQGRGIVVAGNFFIRLPRYGVDNKPVLVTKKSRITVNGKGTYEVENIFGDGNEQPNIICYCLEVV